MTIKLSILTAVFCLIFGAAGADNYLVQPWLLLNSYPSSAALGGSPSVSVKGISNFPLNPSAPAAVKNIELSVSQSVFDSGITCGRAAIGRNFGFGVVSVEAAWFDFGSVETLAVGESGGPEALNDQLKIGAYSLSAGVSKAVGKTLIGTALRISSEDLGAGASYMVSADAGVTVSDAVTNGLDFGISIGSVSVPQGDFEPPMDLKAGITYSLKNEGMRIITFGLGMSWLVFESKTAFDGGIDFNLADAVALRASVRSGYTGGITYAVGAGFDLDGLNIDYAYTPGFYTGGSHSAGAAASFERQNYYEDTPAPDADEGGERNYESYMKSGDYYYRVKQYRKALKYYEYINLFFWKDIEARGDRERSALYQKMGISYYNIKDEARALHYFEQGSYYDRSNEILKFWIKTLKQD